LHQLLSLGTHNEWNDLGNIDQVRDIAANCHNILSDALENCPRDLEASITSIAYLNRCLRFSTERPTHSDLMEKIWPRVRKLPSTGRYGAFFNEMLWRASKISTTVDVMECIEVGNNYFKDAAKEEKCKASSRTSYTCTDHDSHRSMVLWPGIPQLSSK
jgi:hypothetical protein